MKKAYIKTRRQDCDAKQTAAKTKGPQPWHCRFKCFSDEKQKTPCGLRVVMDTNDLCRSIGCNSPDCIAAARLRCMTAETKDGHKACGAGEMDKHGKIGPKYENEGGFLGIGKGKKLPMGSAAPIVEEYSEASKDGVRDPSIKSSRVAVKEDWWKKQFDNMKKQIGVLKGEIKQLKQSNAEVLDSKKR